LSFNFTIVDAPAQTLCKFNCHHRSGVRQKNAKFFTTIAGGDIGRTRRGGKHSANVFNCFVACLVTISVIDFFEKIEVDYN